MVLRRIEKDVVVVGAGTAGAQAALQLVRAGFTVALLDKRHEGIGGARWCNSVVPWQFERAAVPLPADPELRARGGALHMFSPSGRLGFSIPDNPVWEVDMRLLGERLRNAAADGGAELLWNVSDPSLRLERDRPVEITVSRGGERIRIAASLFVDASGRHGALRTRVRSLASWCPPVRDEDLCSAQQFVFEVVDSDGAKRFLHAHDAAPGDSLDWLGPAGGFSAVVIRVEESMQEASVLTGTLGDGRNGSGADMMRQVRTRHPWLGRPLFGGGGRIPLRRPYDRIAAPGIALVGDAACQVMPAHGSGIGYGLMAGKVLAEAVAGADDPGSGAVLRRYQSRFLRDHGGTLAFYDVVRRMSVKLGSAGVERMFETGIMSPAMSEPVLCQKLGRLPAGDLLRRARALARDRDLAATVVPALVRAAAAPALYGAYPTWPSDSDLRAWARLARAVIR